MVRPADGSSPYNQPGGPSAEFEPSGVAKDFKLQLPDIDYQKQLDQAKEKLQEIAENKPKLEKELNDLNREMDNDELKHKHLKETAIPEKKLSIKDTEQKIAEKEKELKSAKGEEKLRIAGEIKHLRKHLKFEKSTLKMYDKAVQTLERNEHYKRAAWDRLKNTLERLEKDEEMWNWKKKDAEKELQKG